MTSPHGIVQSDGLPEPRGYAHAVVAAPGTTVWVAGQIGADATGAVHGGFVAQFDRALGNVVAALDAAGAGPGDVVAMQVFITDMGGYRAAVGDLGPVWRRHMGRHYPAVAAVGVTELVDPAALVEITATAVIGGE